MAAAFRLVRATLVLGVGAWLGSVGFATSSAGPADSLVRLVERLHDRGEIVGAQVLVGLGSDVLTERNVGRVSPDGDRRVDADTRFCIGSASKPFTATIIMSLVGEGLLDLERPIDRWLPQFRTLAVAGGDRAARAPSLRELLTHRGGIFSQRTGLTPRQRRLIRDFTSTLEASVDGIAEEALIAQAGEEYAYSGAGYCVIGRVAEVVTGQPFETLLRERIGKTLGLERTTYFPEPGDRNVAAGARPGTDGQEPHPRTPHLLGANLRFPLVGGGIYSTARDLTRFARMTAGAGRLDERQVLSRTLWTEMTRRQQPAGPTRVYGMGWVLTIDENNDRPTWVGHTGALASSRAALKIDLDGGHYIIVLYTVTDDDGEAETEINEAVEQLMRRL